MSRPLWAILAASALMALLYSAATPVGQAPDESAHVQYVKVLAEEHRLPALNLAARRQTPEHDVDYESHQAPLYYALAVPFYAIGKAIGGDTGAAHGCRLLSILCGLAGTALIWRIARELLPDRPAVWTAATGCAAFLPMRLSITASVSNDALAEATTSLVLLVMLLGIPVAAAAPAPNPAPASTGARGRKRKREPEEGPAVEETPPAAGRDSLRWALGLGAALGVALLSKQNSILLLPPALLAVYLAARPAPGAPHSKEEATVDAAAFFRMGIAVLVPLVGVAGWWYLRNTLIYGDPLGQKVFNWYFADTRRWMEFRDQLGWSFGQYLGRLVLPMTGATFWGAFGHLDRARLFMGPLNFRVPPSSWVYPPLNVALLAAALGGVKWYWRFRQREDASLPNGGRIAVLALHALFVGAGYLRFNAEYFQAQSRYLFPAIAAIAVAVGGGWIEWTRCCERVMGWVIAAAVLLLAVFALVTVLIPAFVGGALSASGALAGGGLALAVLAVGVLIDFRGGTGWSR